MFFLFKKSTYVTEHGIWLSYCYYTCDLNILGTCMEAPFPLSQNGVLMFSRSLSVA
jgi:hypothetical protein